MIYSFVKFGLEKDKIVRGKENVKLCMQNKHII